MKIIGWGWYYLSTILDDYSRYIIHWELCSTMTTRDVEQTINRAIELTKLNSNQGPKLLSDNGPCYISDRFKEYVAKKT